MSIITGKVPGVVTLARPSIKMVKINDGLSIAERMLDWELYELMLRANPKLPRLSIDSKEVGIAAGRDLPVVGIYGEDYFLTDRIERILRAFRKLTGLEDKGLVISSVGELMSAADRIVIGENKLGEVGQWARDRHRNTDFYDAPYIKEWQIYYFVRSKDTNWNYHWPDTGENRRETLGLRFAIRNIKPEKRRVSSIIDFFP